MTNPNDGLWPFLPKYIQKTAVALAEARSEYDRGGRYFGPDDTARVALSAGLEDLDAIIREVDGNHSLGAGALADAIRAKILGD